MMLEAGLILSRFLHYLVLLVLFGISLFPLYVYRQGHPEPLGLARWRWTLLLAGTIVALLTGTLWLMFTVANMAGAFTALADPHTLWLVLRDTDVGHTWLVQLAICGAILGLIGVRWRSTNHDHRPRFTVLLAGLLLASLAGIGHSRQNQGIEEFIHVGADVTHLLAAGAWLGGLLMLACVLSASTSPIDTGQDLGDILLRFSGMGYLAVAGLLASGVIKSWFLVGSFAGLTGTLYGQLLLVKLSLFAGMLSLAAINRFWLVPSLRRTNRQQRTTLIRLRHQVFGEEMLGLLVVMIVSALGTMEPAVSQMSP
jgi:putative copper resistance protein D